ncbi:MAG TPA: hypothetical protein VN914_19525 [Polyangia bacterium]|nr:hypothetical protein [Polyangia bacterium]
MRGAALLLAVLLVGCSMDAARSVGSPGGGGSAGQSDTGGRSGGGGQGGASLPGADAGAPDGGAATGGSSGTGLCAQLIPVSAPAFGDLTAGPGLKLRVRVKVFEPSAPPVTWTWTARFGVGAGRNVMVTPLDPMATEVELPLEDEGTYNLSASAVNGASLCVAQATAFAFAAAKRLGNYRVRITPPPGLVPVQEVGIQVKAGGPALQTLTVKQGQPVSFEPTNEAGTEGVASYVRVNQLGSPLMVEGHTGHGDFKPPLLAVASYDVLLVPDGDVAPFQVLGQTPAALNVLSQKLSQGGLLTGRLRDGAGAPMDKGRVILRAGALTSTVGKTEAGSDFKLWVRAGQFAVSASPDPSSGLPELTLPADSGLVIDDAATAGSLDLTWAVMKKAPVNFVVLGPDGAAPRAGTRVRLERIEPIEAAGTLVYTPPGKAPVTRMVRGQVRVEGQAAVDGTTRLGMVPPGAYRLLLTPSDLDGTSALTSTEVVVSDIVGLSGQARLVSKVKLRGTLLPVPASAGTKVYAAPRALDPPRPAASATVGSDGGYQLDVDPGRDYVVWVDPGLGKPFARAQLAVVSAGTGGASVPDRTLPRALPFTGTLTGEAAGTRIANSVVQVFCDPAAPSCLDPTITFAEGVSDRNGAFTVMLPDPGSP